MSSRPPTAPKSAASGRSVVRVVIADDHAIVRAGLRALLEGEDDLVLVGEAEDGRAAIAEARQHRPDVLLLDLTMPGFNGLDAIAQVIAASPSTRVLVLSMHSAPELVRPALRAGARGYLVKGSGLDDLVRAIRLVAKGERFVDASLPQSIGDLAGENGGASGAGDRDDGLARLTPRERQIVQLIAEGRSNRQMSQALGVSPKTIDTHRTSLMRKLDLHDAPAVTRFAVRSGLVSSEWSGGGRSGGASGASD